MSNEIRFSVCKPAADRIHHVTETDVRVVLSRLPADLYSRLRAVHFNDSSLGARVYGYVNRGRREIALCALPPRLGFTTCCRRSGEEPEHFGAHRGRKWPALAIRRFMLYSTFLHELGHLQLIDPHSRSPRLKFAHEKLADQFALDWRHRLWSKTFDHPDPVHNAPSAEELAAIAAGPQAVLAAR
jgi:hypothetical protein